MTYITMFVVIVSAAVVLNLKKKDFMLLPEKIEQLMNSTPMKCYKNSFYGYTVHYPSFFEQTPDSLIIDVGSCQFRFWNMVQIEQTVFVTYCPDGISVEHIMDSLATVCHATEQRWENDSIFLSGPLYIDDNKISGHQYHAKYVRRGKLLFVQMLTYPDDCKKSVSRLVKQIDDWKVW